MIVAVMSRPIVACLVLVLALSGCAQHPQAPAALLQFSPEISNGIDPVYDPKTSLRTYAEVQDYQALHAVLIDRKADPQVLPLAMERALLVAGPTKVFNDLQADAARWPKLFASGPRRALLDRANEPHVHVEAIFIDEKDMPRAQAREVMNGIAKRIDEGETLEAVYTQVHAQHQYEADGLTLTKIGNMGEFVLSLVKHDAWPFRWVTVPESDVRKLLVSFTGSAVICEQNDGPKRLTLYYVREIYRPAQASSHAVAK